MRRRAAPRLILAALMSILVSIVAPRAVIAPRVVTLGIIHVYGATVVPVTRLAKGIADPHPLAVDALHNRIYAVNPDYGADSVSVLDAATGRVLRGITVGQTPLAVAVDEASNRVFVANRVGDVTTNGSVSVIDAATGRMLRTVRVGRNPTVIAVDERANRAFVVNSGDEPTASRGGVSILDATSGAMIGSIATSSYPQTAVADAPAGRVFIAESGASTDLVRMADAASGRSLGIVARGVFPHIVSDALTGNVVIATGGATNSPSASPPGRVSILNGHTGAVLHTASLGASAAVGGLAVDAASGRIFVVSYDQSSYRGLLRVLDERSGRILRTVSAGLYPIAVAVAPLGRLLILDGDFNSGTVSHAPASIRVLDASGRLLHRADLGGSWAWALVVDGKTDMAYVSDLNNDVSVLDVARGQIVDTLSAQ